MQTRLGTLPQCRGQLFNGADFVGDSRQGLVKFDLQHHADDLERFVFPPYWLGAEWNRLDILQTNPTDAGCLQCTNDSINKP